MSPQIHGRHSLIAPDGTQDDELAEALLETQREISRPIPLHIPPEGFLDRIIKRTLQVLEAVLAFILLRTLWSRKALAAGLAGATAFVGVSVFTADSNGAQLPRVEARGEANGDAVELLARLDKVDQSKSFEMGTVPLDGVGVGVGVATVQPAGTPTVRYEPPTLNELTRPATRNRVSRQGLYWSTNSVDRVISRAMRKYGMSLHTRTAVSGGWVCHESAELYGGMLAYKHYYDQATGLTKTKPVRCFRL